MRTIFSVLGKYRFAAIIAIILMFIELMIELIQPIIMAHIIDEGIAKNDLAVALQSGAFLIGCTIIAFAVGILSSFFSSHVSQSFGFDLREKLYEKVQSFSFANFNRFPESSLITRLTNDVTQLQNTVFMGLRIMLRAPLFVIGSVVMALIVNPRLGLWFTAAIPILFIFLVWLMKRGEKLFRNVQKQLDRVNGVLRQNLMGIRLVRIFQRMTHESERFSHTTGELKDRTVSALRLTELAMPVILLVMNACVILILWFGRIQLDAHGATVGDVVAVVNYAMRTTGVLSIMSMIVVGFSRAVASGQRIEEVILTEVDLKDADDSSAVSRVSAGNVSFERVSFRYPDTEEAVLSDISFRARAGETIAIMGATGSGKSSLLQLIPRLYEAEEGIVRIDGRDHRKLKLDSLRNGIGYVPQDITLFTGTVADNIRWGKEDATMDEVMKAAQQAQIHDTIMKLPMQYDTMIGQKGVNLSGGQKQRLTIARALVRRPVILLLDDSTSALDVHTENALLRALKSIHCTIFLVTQKISSTAGADHILLLDDGKLLDQGTHEELVKKSLLYKKICESQLGKEGVSYA